MSTDRRKKSQTRKSSPKKPIALRDVPDQPKDGIWRAVAKASRLKDPLASELLAQDVERLDHMIADIYRRREIVSVDERKVLNASVSNKRRLLESMGLVEQLPEELEEL